MVDDHSHPRARVGDYAPEVLDAQIRRYGCESWREAENGHAVDRNNHVPAAIALVAAYCGCSSDVDRTHFDRGNWARLLPEGLPTSEEGTGQLSAADVIAGLVGRHETVAACESLTGGLLLAELTMIPGASRAVRGGLVTYATELKTALAGVSAELIATYGVVSQPVAEAMAEGVREACGATWGIALSGVAGPDEVDDQAIGTVCIGITGPNGTVSARERFLGDRGEVRKQSVDLAFELLIGQWTR